MGDSVIAFDIDLNRFHAWSSVTGRVCYNESILPVEAIVSHDTILIEVASPIMYDRSPSITHRKIAWALYNGWVAAQIFYQTRTDQKVLVAPSSEWTLGYPEDVRQSMADVTGEDNHDLRETRCMLFFYSLHPEKWVPLSSYFNSFSFSEKSHQSKFKAAAKQRKRTP